MLGASAALAALPVAVLERLGGVKVLKAGAARIKVETDLGLLVWELPYVELAEGLTIEYRELRDPPRLPDVPTIEVRENETKPWRQVGIVDAMTVQIPVNAPTGDVYGKLEVLEP